MNTIEKTARITKTVTRRADGSFDLHGKFAKRAEACATADGQTLEEWVREAVKSGCAKSEITPTHHIRARLIARYAAIVGPGGPSLHRTINVFFEHCLNDLEAGKITLEPN